MFNKVVFAGGGHRCWWQAGWWETVAPVVGLKPKQIAGVSAGAATACLLFANDATTALAHYHSVLGPDARNVYWSAWRNGRSGVFPHESIYRQALHRLIGGDRFDQLKEHAPEIRIAFSRPPRHVPVIMAVAMGLIAYQLEKQWRKPLHPDLGRKIGFHADYRTVQSCESADELIDLIIASSCTPPFTAIQYQAGQPALDGGLVDNVPINILDAAMRNSAVTGEASVAISADVADRKDQTEPTDTLVLLTRRYPGYSTIFRVSRRVYVQPSRRVAASSWDYTSPVAYEETYAQGREDAELFFSWLQSRPQVGTSS